MDENRSVDVPELLSQVTDLVPADARNEAGAGAGEVRECLRHAEWGVALGVLADFEGVAWQPVEFWELLADAAQEMWLTRDAAWCRWRAWETRHGIIRAELRLAPPDSGGRHEAVPGDGRLRPTWAIDRPASTDGHGDPHIAAIWVESAPEIPPGGRSPVRLAPLSPERWRHLKPGDMITMHGGRPATGTATITDVQRARPSPAH
jgi:hypothetical protein